MADRIVGEYSIKVDEAVKNLDKLAGRVGKLEDASKKAAKNTESEYEKMTSNLMGQFKNLAGAIGIAFSVQQVVALGREMVTLAAQAEGVERAFKRVGSPQLLADLRKATRGTVSDLQLMQNAVKASNFKIPLENLAALFKFAQARARETGESVDYLVDSIILGIGRKSPLILDNLGISAVELRERLKGVGVEASSVGDIAQIIGDIATEELEKMGNQADTTADKIAQITTAFENAKVAVGGEIIDQFYELNKSIEQTSESISKLTGQQDGFNVLMFFAKNAISAVLEPFEKLNELALKGANILLSVKDAANNFADEAQEAAYRLTLNNEQLIEFNKLGETAKKILVDEWLGLRDVNDIREDDYLTMLKSIAAKNEDNAATQEQIKNVAYYLALIKDLEDEQKQNNTTLERNAVINAELKVAREELARLLGKETEAVKKANDEWEKFLKTLREIDADDPFAGQLLKGEQEVDQLSKSLQEAFGTEGTERIQMFWDDFLRSSLEALDKVGDETENTFDEINSYLDGTLQAWATVTNTVAQLTEAQYNRQLQALENQLRREQISREEYDRRRAALAREQFQKQKEFSIVQAVINTALGVTNAFATAPNIILGAVLAAVVAAAGAAEIATIASQPVPQFAEGGYVDKFGQFHGRKHAQGGITIEAEGGEFITSAKYARPNADILKAINSGDWEKYKVENIIAPAIEQVLKGGFEGMGASYELNSMFNDKNLLRAFDRQRANEREVGRYIVDGIGKQLRSNLKDRYV